MPIGAELLNPIPGANPSGTNLRYDPVYDKIKEARRQEDDVPQGEWTYAIKKSDWPIVVKLCTEAIANRSKDLQLAAWLTEAMVFREGFSGLHQGLDLCRSLLEQFWDSLYPEPEDGDLELRATPLDWIGGRLDEALKKVPLTAGGLDWYSYKESRTVPYEAEVGDSEQKQAAREQAISDGKLTPEDFDKAVLATSKEAIRAKLADIESSLESVASLKQECESRFGEYMPGFSGLQESLSVVSQAVKAMLRQKLEQEPDGESPAEVSTEAPSEMTAEEPGETPRPKAKAIPAGEPADVADAISRVIALAAWMRKQDAYQPLPYVLVRSLRWGELRSGGSELDANLLEPPSTDLRQRIRRLANEGNWEELMGACEEAMALPCGRGWLDLQRYFAQACDNYGGFDAARNAVVSELRCLLADYPSLPTMMMLDDTPTANPDTRTWLESIVASTKAEHETESSATYEETPQQEGQPPDAFVLAKEAARSGRIDEAIEILTQEAAHERSGRTRFQRKMQLAEICMATDHYAIASPILEELAREIETRKLEEWEAPDMLAQALTLLYRCMHKMKEDGDAKQRLYARICRLDPLQALELAK